MPRSGFAIQVLPVRHQLCGMSDLAETRKFCVQSLREAAKSCAVALVQDSASKEKVADFAEAVQNSAGPAAEKTIFKSFQKSCTEVDKDKGAFSIG